MSDDATTAADVIDAGAPLVAGLLALIPGAGPIISAGVAAGLGLTSRLLRAGLSPEDIHAIDVSALRRAVAAEDAKLDARAARADAQTYPPDTEPAP